MEFHLQGKVSTQVFRSIFYLPKKVEINSSTPKELSIHSFFTLLFISDNFSLEKLLLNQALSSCG